jgi:hypothetical protein
MGFGLVIGFINHLQVVTTINYNTVPDFHTTDHSTLISLVSLHQSSWIYNTETIKVSLNHTFPISLHYNTHKVFKSHIKSSQPDLLYSSLLLVATHSACFPCYYLSIAITVCLGILLTYIAEGQTSTNSKHISRDPCLLLLCDVTAPAPAARHAENSLLYCCMLINSCRDVFTAAA